MTESGTCKTRAVLAGDGGLFTAAAFAAALGMGVLAGTGSHTSNVAAGIGMAAAVALGPLVAWRLHGRRAGRDATVAALLGFVAGGGAGFALLLVAGAAMRAGKATGLFVTSEDATATVGSVAVTVVAAVLLALCVWLATASVGDLLPGRRAHTRLDAGRLASSAVTAAYIVVVLTRVAGGDEANAGMYATLLLAGPALMGAAAVSLAHLLAPRDRRQARRESNGPSAPAPNGRT
jgi:hypothetical protein